MGKWTHRLSNVNEEDRTADCKQCGPVRINFHGRRSGGQRKVRCINASQADRRKKSETIKQLKLDTGCQYCGYNEHAEALQWHHIDFSEDRNRSPVTRRELAKCEVVCANCHRLLHAGILRRIEHIQD